MRWSGVESTLIIILIIGVPLHFETSEEGIMKVSIIRGFGASHHSLVEVLILVFLNLELSFKLSCGAVDIDEARAECGGEPCNHIGR